MCRRKGKWKMLSLKKISRHIPRKILYPSVTEPKTLYLPSLQPNVWQAPFLANFVSRSCIHSYLSNCIFPSSHLSFFSSFFSLFYPHTFFTSIYFHAKIKYVRGDTLLVSQSIFRVSIMLRTVGGTEVSLVSPLLREKEFECISTFLRETCSICSSYFLTCSLAIFVQSFTACLQIVFLFLFCFCLNCRSCSFCELHIFIE